MFKNSDVVLYSTISPTRSVRLYPKVSGLAAYNEMVQLSAIRRSCIGIL